MHAAQSTQSRLTTHALVASTTVAVALNCHLAAILTDAKQHVQRTDSHAHSKCLLLWLHAEVSVAGKSVPCCKTLDLSYTSPKVC